MSVKPEKLRIGTRGSPLALRQAEMVRAALGRVAPGLALETVVIRTSGDWNPADGDVRLSADAGGKAQFAKEIEEALLDRAIDIAVHSMKDMESVLPEGLEIAHMLPREDPRDIFILNEIAKNSQSISGLPHGLRIGTCSVRREAFLRSLRPDLDITPFRGNVQTRIDKLRAGAVDATLLAAAGLKRLGLESQIGFYIETDEMLPAAGQGAVGIEMRAGEAGIAALLDEISHAETVLCVTAERAALRALGGSCHTPLGAHAEMRGASHIHLRLALAALDGELIMREEGVSPSLSTPHEADAFGFELGQALKAAAPPMLLRQRA